MAKSAKRYVRIEPDVKEHKQSILQKGLPFEVKLPEHPLDISHMTDEQRNAELEKGYADMQAGRTISAAGAFADIRREYGV